MRGSLTRHFSAMARNNAWANARLLAACAQLSDAAFAADRVSYHPSLQRTLNHSFIVDLYYLADLEGPGRVRLADEVPYPRAADLAVAQAAADRRLIAFCDGLDERDLDRPVAIDRGGGVVEQEAVAATLAHLFQHQIHHRGQAHAMLAGTRVAPPQLDEFFLARDRRRRDEELAALGLSEEAPM
jgi:uncharacterized damage-inducible protein DinB